MSVTKRLTIDNVDFDNRREMDELINQAIATGLEQVRAEGDELRRRGLLDANGKVLLQELPPDMREGSERDFGG